MHNALLTVRRANRTQILYRINGAKRLSRLIGRLIGYHNRGGRHSTLRNTAPIDYIIHEEIRRDGPRTAVQGAGLQL